jgi:hypothetical protein
MTRLSLVLALAACWSYIAAHLVIVYPGWRGNNLITSGLEPDGSVPPDGLGTYWDNKTESLQYPYGMQWMYPCQCPSSTSKSRELPHTD